MHFQLKDVLQAIGPNASIVFAAWIFMSFLQERYSAAFGIYRTLIQQCREGGDNEHRLNNMRDQVLLFRRRFELMGLALNMGLAAAILLIATLIGGALNVIFPHLRFIEYASTVAAIAGFALVIVAAALVWRENAIIKRFVTSELLDVPDLARCVGQPLTSAPKPAINAARQSGE